VLLLLLFLQAYPQYDFIIECYDSDQCEEFMTQFEQQINLPTGQGPLGNFFCDADRPDWDPDSAELFEVSGWVE
jgi:hypothetical protein